MEGSQAHLKDLALYLLSSISPGRQLLGRKLSER